MVEPGRERKVSTGKGGGFHIARKTVAIMPILLVLGIVAQTMMLVAVIVLYVPLLVWPGVMDKPYQWVIRGMGKIAIRSIIGRRSEARQVA